MSVLQEIGIQEWRLRGRKPVRIATDESRVSRVPTEPLLDTHIPSTESNDGSATLLAKVQADGLKPEAANLSAVPRSDSTQAIEVEQTHEPPILSNIEPTSLNQQASLGNDAKPAAEPSAPAAVKSDKARSDAIVMPVLRPAPVPLDTNPAMDLSIDGPAHDEPVIDYEDADIPALDSDEASAAVSMAMYGLDEQAPATSGTTVEGATVESTTVESTVVSGELSELDWRALQTRVSNDQACPSCGQHQSSLGYGDVLADWMFIADAPTSAEIQAHTLFLERAGQLYEAILTACGLTRDTVYTTTVFKCSPPADLSLSPQCDKLIHRQIELVQPKVIVTFGEFASQAILRANESFAVLSGTRHQYVSTNSRVNTSSRVIPSHTLQQLLAEPALKADVWRELKQAMLSIKG